MALINADDLDISPPDWLVKDLIPRVGLGIVHGPSTFGKSLVTDNELGLAVANGTPFFDRDVVRGTVAVALGEGLYDAGVRKQARLARQAADDAVAMAAARSAGGDAAAQALAATLPAYTDDAMFVLTEPFPVPVSRTGEPTAALAAALAALRQLPDLELVILDALSDFSGGLSISNDASANRFVLGLKRMVKELDCCVLAVHHNTADGKKMIGAQRLFNAADFVIEVVPESDPVPGEPKTATLTCRKNKYGPAFEPMTYVIEPCEWDQPATDEEGNPVPGEPPTRVRSATVRLRADDGSSVGGGLRMPGQNGQGRPAPQVPDLRTVEQPRKRNGVLRRITSPAAPADLSLARREREASLRDRARELAAEHAQPDVPAGFTAITSWASAEA
jgi:AAA domain